jgi:AraC-like DNA-binding protein
MDSAPIRIPDIGYQPAQPGLPVESFTLAALVGRIGADRLSRPERLDFNLVVICTGGEGTHEVDFEPAALRPGRVLHVRPTQVHRWTAPQRYEAVLVLFPDIPELRPPGWPVGPRGFPLASADWDATARLLDLLSQETARAQPPHRRDRALAALRELLILRLRLDVDHDARPGPSPAPYRAFRALLESELGWSRSVTDHARRLGYAPRTLTRACLAATGRTAKQFLNDRLLLEARRLLAHTGGTTAAVAAQLGFSEATNFTKFFVHGTGLTPSQWRARSRGGPA